MSEMLCSVGLDVGTTTTQMILSQLRVENRASGFAVPDMAITERQILYKSPVYFTPLLDESHVDGEAIGCIVEKEYEKAGILKQNVDTGAIIITGETSRKENARAVLDSLSSFAGEFVVATAGPDLESILAAKGAGAVAYSERTGKRVLHMDIGGGTSNLSLIEDGKIIQTGCLNVGGRLLKFDEAGTLTYVSPVLDGLTALRVGDRPSEEEIMEVARLLTRVLQMAAGLEKATDLLPRLTTQEAGNVWQADAGAVISFSGGVADCIEREQPFFAFGDMGPALGRAIRESLLCRNAYMLGKETIRATVIGAGCHSAQLSGSTVFYRGISLPVKNLPVVKLSVQEQICPEVIARKRKTKDQKMVVLAMPGYEAPTYEQVQNLANCIAQATQGGPVLVCLEQDMAKALGHSLVLRLPPDTPCLCIDRLRLQEDSFLDVGTPVGPALPVVIKTLILSQ